MPWALVRSFVLGLRNVGCGIAKFPSIRYRRACGLTVSTFGIDGSGGFGLSPRPSESELEAFRGGVDEVIYPGELRKITRLLQMGENKGIEGLPAANVTFGPNGPSRARWVFKEATFSCEVSCEGIPTVTIERHT